MFKKSLTLFLALVLLFTGSVYTSSTAIANNRIEDNNDIEVLKDNSTEKIVKTWDDDYYYISKYDKVNKILDFKVYSIKDNSRVYLYYENVGLLDNEKEQNLSNSILHNTLYSTYKNENTYLNYEYTIYNSSSSNRKWNIRRPKWNIVQWYSRDVFEYGSNEINLNMFKVQVDKINIKESEVLGSTLELFINVAEFSAAIASGGTLSLAAIKGLLSSIGESVSLATSIKELIGLCSLAYSYYMKVN